MRGRRCGGRRRRTCRAAVVEWLDRREGRVRGLGGGNVCARGPRGAMGMGRGEGALRRSTRARTFGRAPFGTSSALCAEPHCLLLLHYNRSALSIAAEPLAATLGELPALQQDQPNAHLLDTPATRWPMAARAPEAEAKHECATRDTQGRREGTASCREACCWQAATDF